MLIEKIIQKESVGNLQYLRRLNNSIADLRSRLPFQRVLCEIKSNKHKPNTKTFKINKKNTKIILKNKKKKNYEHKSRERTY